MQINNVLTCGFVKRHSGLIHMSKKKKFYFGKFIRTFCLKTIIITDIFFLMLTIFQRYFPDF